MNTLARYLTLASLSAFTAEFLLGDQYLGGFAPITQQVPQFIIYVAFYGSAAVLIRESARRTGRGWPTILVLALAFGVLEEGVVDQSLFNPDFAGEHLLAFGAIPWLGMAGPWTVYVLSLHVIWSIGAPIAIAEALFPMPGRRPAVAPQTQAPWLGIPALVGLAVLGVLAGSAILFFSVASGFAASPAQLAGSIIAVVVLVVIALLIPRRTPRGARPVWPAAAVALVLCSAYQLLSRGWDGLDAWVAVALALAILAAGILLAARLRLDVLGLAAGAVLTYCWVGLTRAWQTGTPAVVEQTVLVIVAVAIVLLAIRRRDRTAVAAQPGRRPQAA